MGGSRDRLWGSPLGDAVLTESGRMLLLAPEASADLKSGPDLGVLRMHAALFDPATHTIFASSGNVLYSFNLESGIPIGTHDAHGPGDALGRFEERLALVQLEDPGRNSGSCPTRCSRGRPTRRRRRPSRSGPQPGRRPRRS